MKTKVFLILLAGFGHLSSLHAHSAEVALTIDDFDTHEAVMFTPQERNHRILAALEKHGRLKAGLFVVARNVTSESGKSMLNKWGEMGHLIGNHTYSHPNYHSKKVTYEAFSEDFKKADEILKDFVGFKRFFRYPMSHEGETREKRDKMRKLLVEAGYRDAHLAIDASEWYINERLKQRLAKDPNADLSPYREYFLEHMWSRAQYYSGLSRRVLGRDIKYNIVVHFNLLNSLFMDDLLTLFEKKGWKWISAKEAFQDPVYQSTPQTLPAGQSLVWALAKETGKYDDQLRYPAEDGEYEKDAMDKLAL